MSHNMNISDYCVIAFARVQHWWGRLCWTRVLTSNQEATVANSGVTAMTDMNMHNMAINISVLSTAEDLRLPRKHIALHSPLLFHFLY